MPATSRYAITLNGQGYVLVEESYRKEPQQPFNPRFSTGDPSTGDLSFWQFLEQESWGGGSGQIDFTTTSKIRKSRGWSFLTGKPKLAGGNAGVSLDGGKSLTALADGWNSGSAPYPHQMLPFGSNNRGRRNLMVIGPNSSYSYVGTYDTLRASTTQLIGITQLLALGGCLWTRQAPSTGEGGFMVCTIDDAGTNKIKVFDASMGSPAEYDCETPNGMAMEPTCHIPLSQNALLAAGTGTYIGSGGSVGLMLLRLDYPANSWTLSTAKIGFTSDLPDGVSPFWGKDSNGTLYLTLTGIPTDSSSEAFSSAVAIITSADALASDGPILSETMLMPDFHLTGATSVNGTIYYLGCKIIRDATVKYRSCVIKHPGTIIWESEYTSTSLSDVVPRTMFRASRTETYFFDRKLDSGEYTPLMRLTLNDAVEEVMCFQQDVTGTRRYPYALGKVGQYVHLADGAAGDFKRLTVSAADTRTSTALSCDLYLSKFGANTSLINKTLFKVMIELSEAITSGQTMTIYANIAGTYTSIGTIVNADGTRKEITLTTEVTGSSFDLRISMPGTATWPGEINKVTLQYIPTQLKKKQWSFLVRNTLNLKLIDGTREQSSPATLQAATESAWSSNVPVTFVDIDGTSYSVIVTAFRCRVPLYNSNTGKLEFLTGVELLQV